MIELVNDIIKSSLDERTTGHLGKNQLDSNVSMACQDIEPNDSKNDGKNASVTLRFCEILMFLEMLTCFEVKY